MQIATEERVRASLDDNAVIVTDGVRGKAAQDVKPFGKIVFVAQPSMADAVLWALAKLVEISPVGPAEGGHYKDDHVVMINGKAVTGNLRVALAEIGPGDRVQIVNPRIYARKLEGATASARTSGFAAGAVLARRPMVSIALFSSLVVQRYSKSLFVDFKYVKLNTRREGLGRRRRRSRQDQRQMGGA